VLQELATEEANIMFSPEDGVRLIQAESNRLREYLDALPSDALNEPSACEDWTVGDVVAHLIWFAEDDYGAAIARGLRGDSSPPADARPSASVNPTSADSFMSQTAINVRKRLGDQLLPAFDSVYGKFNQLLQGIGPGDWGKLCFHPMGTRTVSTYMAGCVQEVLIHGWDIRSSFEQSPSLPNESLPFLMDRIARRRLPWQVPFSSSFATPLCYRFELTGAEAGRWDVVVEYNKARLESASESPADVSLTCKTDTFALVMYGRLTLESARVAGRLNIAGDESLIPDFDRWIKGG
jgi:uncharacterized protein (TIGR03083 family)